MINCIAIDDEPLALQVIQGHCDRIKSVKLLAVFLSSVEAVEYLKKHPVDVIFLDINMPEINGIHFNKFISPEIQIVFITAYEEHALASYDVGATDYLLKPVSFDRFYEAIIKCTNNQSIKSLSLKENIAPTILVKSDKKVVQIPIGEIIYVEGLKDYAKIFYANGQREIVRESLKKIMEVLAPYDFLRVHRSYIVPVKKIQLFSGNTIKIGDIEIPISKSYRTDLVTLFKGKGILGDRSRN